MEAAITAGRIGSRDVYLAEAKESAREAEGRMRAGHDGIARVVARSRPGVTVPAVKSAARPRTLRSETSGLEKSSSDLEC